MRTFPAAVLQEAVDHSLAESLVQHALLPNLLLLLLRYRAGSLAKEATRVDSQNDYSRDPKNKKEKSKASTKESKASTKESTKELYLAAEKEEQEAEEDRSG